MVKNRISRKKVYARIGEIKEGSGIRCSIHHVVGIELVRNEHPHEYQKEEGYDTYDLRIIEEVTHRGEVVGHNKHKFNLFGKRGLKL
tara:strand:- start:244 stop:504 length:261 start_codon:yes stop_codon:yes gene_type:complete